MKEKQDIQKTSSAQLLVVAGFAVYIFAVGLFLNGQFSKQPYDMFGIAGSTNSSTTGNAGHSK